MYWYGDIYNLCLYVALIFKLYYYILETIVKSYRSYSLTLQGTSDSGLHLVAYDSKLCSNVGFS